MCSASPLRNTEPKPALPVLVMSPEGVWGLGLFFVPTLCVRGLGFRDGWQGLSTVKFSNMVPLAVSRPALAASSPSSGAGQGCAGPAPSAGCKT